MQDKPTLEDIEIPKSVLEALCTWWGSVPSDAWRYRSTSEVREHIVTATEAVKVALLSLATNPVIDTEIIGKRRNEWDAGNGQIGLGQYDIFMLSGYISRIFLRKPDPVPEEVKALLIPTIDDEGNLNARILKAYALGKAHSNDTL